MLYDEHDRRKSMTMRYWVYKAVKTFPMWCKSPAEFYAMPQDEQARVFAFLGIEEAIEVDKFNALLAVSAGGKVVPQ